MASASEPATPEKGTPPPQPGGEDASGAGPPVFRHPQWTVGVVLIFGAMSIVAGLVDPIWFLIGSPFILALAVYVWVRFRR